MGSEQSTQGGGGRQCSAPTSPNSSLMSPSVARSFDPLLALSRDSTGGPERQDSIASDVDGAAEVPYVPYTVNKPIGGESPKKKKSQSGATYRLKFSTLSSRSAPPSRSTMVVLNRGSQMFSEEMENDPDLNRLRDIPSFLPIMRASLRGGGAATAKDPDILERLDYRGLLGLTSRYEAYLHRCAVVVSTEQAEINRHIREADTHVSQVTQALADRQKQYARYSERLSKVQEMSRCLARCHLLLNENIEQMEVLNNMLPPEERLEPFVWTTG